MTSLAARVPGGDLRALGLEEVVLRVHGGEVVVELLPEVDDPDRLHGVRTRAVDRVADRAPVDPETGARRVHRRLVLLDGLARHRVQRTRPRRALQPAAQLPVALRPLRGRRLQRPDAESAVRVEPPAQVLLDDRVAALADELAPPAVVRQVLLVGQQHRPGLLEQVGLRAVDGVGVRGVRARPVQAGAGRGGRCRDVEDLLPRRCRQCGERPEDRNLRTGDGVEERDDQHRQRTGQHAGGQPARHVELRRGRTRPGTAGRAVEAGSEDGRPGGPMLGSRTVVHVDRHHAVTYRDPPQRPRRVASTGSGAAVSDPVSAGRGQEVRVPTRSGGTGGRTVRAAPQR